MRAMKHLVLVTILLPLMLGCGGGGSSDAGPSGSESSLRAANTDSAYADVLVDCVSAELQRESCRLSTLPLIGQDHPNPTVANILDRTVVSNNWMAKRFRELLEEVPAEVLPLFSATTAVVIAADIRPSFYTALTGAIYLDPAFLWLTDGERTTISTAPDFRSDFGNELNFVGLSRYIADGDYAWEYFSVSEPGSRELGDIEQPLVALLLHELAHANDAFPPAELSRLSYADTVLNAARGTLANGATETLRARQPLNSSLWQDLGEVLFLGRAATGAERILNATEVGLEFESDGGNDDYAYASDFEDTAMLFEEVMMKYLYDIDREVAFTNYPSSENRRFCDSYVVAWGFRNRLAEPLVRSRAETVLQIILDETDVSAYLGGFTEPLRMSNDITWCTIQPLNGALTVGPAATPAVVPMRADSFYRQHGALYYPEQ